MSEGAAEWFWTGVAAYLGVGAIVTAAAWAGGIARIDRIAATAPWRVKAILSPGMAALWPILLLRMTGVRPREDRG
jgi:hypothetical protein